MRIEDNTAGTSAEDVQGTIQDWALQGDRRQLCSSTTLFHAFQSFRLASCSRTTSSPNMPCIRSPIFL